MIKILFYVLLFFSSDCFAKIFKPTEELSEELSVQYEMFGIAPNGVIVICSKQINGTCIDWQTVQDSIPICAVPLYIDIIVDDKTVLKIGYEFNQSCLDIKNSFNIVK